MKTARIRRMLTILAFACLAIQSGAGATTVSPHHHLSAGVGIGPKLAPDSLDDFYQGG